MSDTPKSRADLARRLGVTGAIITRDAARGMPTHSVRAAMAWRRNHLDPARTKGGPRQPAPQSQAVAAVAALIEGVVDLLEAQGRIDERLLPSIRRALAAVPDAERELVAMPVALWDRLCADLVALEVRTGVAAAGWPSVRALQLEDETAIYYAAAAGELVVRERMDGAVPP